MFSQQSITIDAEQFSVKYYPLMGIHRYWIGNVVIQTPQLTIHCDTAVDVPARQQLFFLGNVHVVMDSLSLWSEKIRYDREIEYVVALKSVEVSTPSYRIWADSAVYKLDSAKLIFHSNVWLQSDSLQLHAEQLTYWRTTKAFTAKGGVQLLMSDSLFIQTSRLTGSLQSSCYTAFDSTQVWQLAERDTLEIRARYFRTCNDTTIARSNVVITSSSHRLGIRAKEVLHRRDTLWLFAPARLWLDSAEVTADSVISIATLPDSTRSLSAYPNASVQLPTADSLRWQLLKAQTIEIKATSQYYLHSVTAAGNAYSHYFIRSSEAGNEGVIQHRADTIILKFHQRTLDTALWIGSVYGRFYPESFIPPELLLRPSNLSAQKPLFQSPVEKIKVFQRRGIFLPNQRYRQ